MDEKYYSLKKVFALNFRIGLLTSLVIFILGFSFFPEIEQNNTQDFFLNPYIDPYFGEPGPIIIPCDTAFIKLIRIKEINPIMHDEDTSYKRIHYKKIHRETSFRTFTPYETPPKPLNLDKTSFEYPEHLKAEGIEGTVYLELWIDEVGKVVNVILQKSVHPELDKIAVENARKIKFSPAIQGDKPVAVHLSFPVRFEIE